MEDIQEIRKKIIELGGKPKLDTDLKSLKKSLLYYRSKTSDPKRDNDFILKYGEDIEKEVNKECQKIDDDISKLLEIKKGIRSNVVKKIRQRKIPIKLKTDAKKN